MLTLTINGREHASDGNPDMPLLWYLRDVLGMTGSKFGCGMAMCGACTVHVDDVATRSCVLPVAALAGRSITTIEGLSAHGTHPVPRAWQALNGAHWGYCQGGQIMQAASLLRENPTPSDDDIDVAMSGNLCRCGTYPRIRAAIHLAAGQSGAES